MDRKYTKNNKAGAFLKKNVYYIIMLLCLAAIATMVILTIINNNKEVIPEVVPVNNVNEGENVNNNNNNNNTTPIVFASPVANANIIKDYTMDTVVWHQSLGQYSVHDGIDFAGNDGDAVCAVYDGTIEEVTYDALNGYKVVIKHNDTLKTVYYSLNEPSITVGTAVTKGQTIGTMGVTATKEMSDNAHVHFMVMLNNTIADPYQYFPTGDK